MTTRISRQEFVGALSADDVALDLASISTDSRAALTRAGLDGDRLRRIAGTDGAIDTDAEYQRLFDVIDDLDRNGSRHSIDVFDDRGQRGQLTSSAEAMRAVLVEIKAQVLSARTAGRPSVDDVFGSEATERRVPATGSAIDVHKLGSLSAEFRDKAVRVVERMVEKGYDVRVVWGSRTHEQNQALVERGLAARNSRHLTGNAVDLINRANPYPNDRLNAYYLDLRDAVIAEGLVWGGDFKSRWDPTHFEMPKETK